MTHGTGWHRGRQASAAIRLSSEVPRLAVGLAGRFRAWRRRQHFAPELSSLGNLLLTDIELARENIPNVVRAGPRTGLLLERLLDRIAVDRGHLRTEPWLHGKLQMGCFACAERSACARWSRSGVPDVDYHSFCRNAELIERLPRTAGASPP